jgi:putative cardiolipin synthase
VELWEFSGAKTLHAKSVVVDGKITLIGSYNLDPRSRNLNTEVAVAVEDAEIAAITAESMERNLESAWRIGRDGKPEGQNKNYPEASLSRRFRVGLYKLLLPLTRRQL